MEVDSFVGEEMPRNVIEVLVENTSVEFDLNQLPDVNDILAILNEQHPLDIWMQIAEQFRKNFEFEHMVQLLERAKHIIGDVNLRVKCFTLLAGYQLEKVQVTTDDNEIKDFLREADHYLNEAEKLDNNNEECMVSRGHFHLMKGNVARARAQFDLVLTSKDSNNILAQLGRAAIDFNEGNYKVALQHYRNVIRSKPDCPSSVRVGIGMCFAHLKNFEKAQLAFERALSLNPENDDALVGLAVIQMNKHNQEAMSDAINKLSSAYEHNKHNPMVLNLLGNHFFHRGEYGKTRSLVKVVTHCNQKEMKAEALFHLARVYHAEGELDIASKLYYQATINSSDYLPAHYGLGQLSIYNGKLAQARSSFERVLKIMPSNLGAMKILASLYVCEGTSISSQNKATVLFEKITQQQPEDIEAWIDLGMLLLRKDCKRALECFETAQKMLRDIDQPLPPELVNNIASLYTMEEKYELAEKLYDEALAMCVISNEIKEEYSEDDIAFYKGMEVTVTYNKARLFEMQKETEKALELYNSILKNHSDYGDCVLRKGCIERDRDNIKDAINHFKEAVALDDVVSRTLLGGLYIMKRQYKQAETLFINILSKRDGDAYGCVALGNIYYGLDKKDKAIKYYKMGLIASKENLYAVNGLGCVFAAKGDIVTAKDLFQKVREAAQNDGVLAHVLVNLAHTYTHQGLFVEAMALYEHALRQKRYERSASLHSAIARAQYKQGEYQKARESLEKAHEIDPEDQRTTFNIALAKQQEGREIVVNTLTLEKATQAEELLLSASSAFASLKTPTGAVKYNYKQAPKEEQFCQDLLAQLRQKKAVLEINVQQTQRRSSEVRNAQEEFDKHQKEKKAKEIAKEKALEEERRRKIEAFEAKSAVFDDIFVAAEEKPKKTRKAKVKVENDEDEMGMEEYRQFDNEREEGEDGEQETPRRRQKRKQGKRGTSSSSRKRKSAKVEVKSDLDDSDDDDDDDDEGDLVGDEDELEEPEGGDQMARRIINTIEKRTPVVLARYFLLKQSLTDVCRQLKEAKSSHSASKSASHHPSTLSLPEDATPSMAMTATRQHRKSSPLSHLLKNNLHSNQERSVSPLVVDEAEQIMSSSTSTMIVSTTTNTSTTNQNGEDGSELCNGSDLCDDSASEAHSESTVIRTSTLTNKGVLEGLQEETRRVPMPMRGRPRRLSIESNTHNIALI
eukprot:m.135058 g.135058  ORF g.135058 m.135058 type:complete len:1193 (+) comp13117_c0_seq8:51-3629(+)